MRPTGVLNIPFVVLTPDTEEEIAGFGESCIALGLTIIPRGGGRLYRRRDSFDANVGGDQVLKNSSIWARRNDAFTRRRS